MNTCKRCSKCCKTSPPTLHSEDKSLVLTKQIPREALLTLRQGEVLFDHHLQKFVTLEREVIKIRYEKQACIFLQKNNCSLYALRPLECRVFFCSNPEPLLNLKNKKLLSRLEIIEPKSAIGQLILEHEEICALSKIKGYLKENNQEKLAKAINFDLTLRNYLQEKLKIKKEILDFYFGRNLKKIIATIKHLIAF